VGRSCNRGVVVQICSEAANLWTSTSFGSRALIRCDLPWSLVATWPRVAPIWELSAFDIAGGHSLVLARVNHPYQSDDAVRHGSTRFSSDTEQVSDSAGPGALWTGFGLAWSAMVGGASEPGAVMAVAPLRSPPVLLVGCPAPRRCRLEPAGVSRSAARQRAALAETGDSRTTCH